MFKHLTCFLKKKCAELNNYNTLMEILAGLNLHPVQRLKETWKVYIYCHLLLERLGYLPPHHQGLSDKYRESMENLESLMENKQNYKNYRERLERVQLTGESALPYLGTFTFPSKTNTLPPDG